MAARSCVADRVYRALLRLYPLRFQEEFAADMALDFADASDEAWTERRWAGLAGVWIRSGTDLAGSLVLQWARTRTLFLVLAACSMVLSTVTAAFTMVPQGPLFANVEPGDRDLAALILLTACLMLIIAATIVLDVCLLRPLLQRRPKPLRAPHKAVLKI